MNLVEIHEYCKSNRPEIQKSELVGCFYCLQIYEAAEIEDYIGIGETTAKCSRCGIDSVIPDASGVQITQKLLKDMYDRWFSS